MGTANNRLKKMLMPWPRIIGLIILIFLVLDFATIPLRKKWSSNYLVEGDAYLVQKKYLSAQLEYQKALLLYGKNAQAKSHEQLANEAQQDVSVLNDFYREQNITKETAAFDQANVSSNNPNILVKNCRELLLTGEYQLALIPVKRAMEKDDNYTDGWLYFGIANFEVATNIELLPENKARYVNESRSALIKAKNLGADAKIVDQYLSKL